MFSILLRSFVPLAIFLWHCPLCGEQGVIRGWKARSGTGAAVLSSHESGAHVVDDANPSGVASARLRLDDDFDILAEPGQQAHQALTGEIR